MKTLSGEPKPTSLTKRNLQKTLYQIIISLLFSVSRITFRLEIVCDSVPKFRKRASNIADGTFSRGGNAESTRARFTPRAGEGDSGTTRSSELSPSAMAFSGRPIRPEPWVRAGFAFSPFAKSAWVWPSGIAFEDAREIEAQIRARSREIFFDLGEV